MTAHPLTIQKQPPFEVLTEHPKPNETTRRALAEAEAKALGAIPDNSPAFTNAKDALEYLDKL